MPLSPSWARLSAASPSSHSFGLFRGQSCSCSSRLKRWSPRSRIYTSVRCLSFTRSWAWGRCWWSDHHRFRPSGALLRATSTWERPIRIDIKHKASTYWRGMTIVIGFWNIITVILSFITVPVWGGPWGWRKYQWTQPAAHLPQSCTPQTCQ